MRKFYWIIFANSFVELWFYLDFRELNFTLYFHWTQVVFKGQQFFFVFFFILCVFLFTDSKKRNLFDRPPTRSGGNTEAEEPVKTGETLHCVRTNDIRLNWMLQRYLWNQARLASEVATVQACLFFELFKEEKNKLQFFDLINTKKILMTIFSINKLCVCQTRC